MRKRRVSFVAEFELIPEPEALRTKIVEYEGIKKIALKRGNNPLAHHCEDMIEELEKVKKKKGWR